MRDFLADARPRLARQLPKIPLAELPTPVETRTVRIAGRMLRVAIKRDDLTAPMYGGNKVRKLEYLLHRARARNVQRIATFGTVASHHALATALYARELGFECTCLLSHQVATPACASALSLHLGIGTEIVRYGGGREQRIATLRDRLWNRGVFLVPPGGSNWLGAVGFVAAGLELAAQVAAAELPAPERVYVAAGTMSTAVGLALGLALAGLRTEVQAVQVTEDFVSSPDRMRRLLEKTAVQLARLDPSVPGDLASRARWVFRRGYLGPGYARGTAAADRAIAVARDELGIGLEVTYTGKAMAAMLDDLESLGGESLFWNTYNSRPLAPVIDRPGPEAGLPAEFERYFG